MTFGQITELLAIINMHFPSHFDTKHSIKYGFIFLKMSLNFPVSFFISFGAKWSRIIVLTRDHASLVKLNCLPHKTMATTRRPSVTLIPGGGSERWGRVLAAKLNQLAFLGVIFQLLSQVPNFLYFFWKAPYLQSLKASLFFKSNIPLEASQQYKTNRSIVFQWTAFSQTLKQDRNHPT